MFQNPIPLTTSPTPLVLVKLWNISKRNALLLPFDVKRAKCLFFVTKVKIMFADKPSKAKKNIKFLSKAHKFLTTVKNF